MNWLRVGTLVIVLIAIATSLAVPTSPVYACHASRIELEPPTASNLVGTKHTLTVTVYDENDNPFPNQAISWSIESGPGYFVSVEDTTDTSGQARAVITSTEIGITTIKATISDTLYATATKSWIHIQCDPAILVTKTGPTEACVGDNVTFTITVEHDSASDGSPVIISNVSDDLAGTASYVSGDNGNLILEPGEVWTFQVDYTIQSTDPDPLVNTATAYGLDLDGDPVSDSDAHSLDIKRYRIELEPPTASNLVGTEHTLTVTVYDENDNPFPNQAISWSIESGPGYFVSVEDTTDTSGQARAVITSTEIGTTTIKAAVSDTLYATATKTWMSEPIPLRYLEIDFLGKITKGLISTDGRLLNHLEATSPDGLHMLGLDKDTKVVDTKGNVVTLIKIVESEAQDIPANTIVVGDVYDFQPSGITFSKPVRLTLTYDINELPKNVVSINLAYYSLDLGWIELEEESGVVAEMGKIHTSIEHFTLFAILAKITAENSAIFIEQPAIFIEQPAIFTLSKLTIIPSLNFYWEKLCFLERGGKSATISIDITNVGGQTGNYNCSLYINDIQEAAREITIEPEQTRTITFTVSDIEPGSYLVEIGNLSGEFTSYRWYNCWLMLAILAFILLCLIIWCYLIPAIKSRIKTQLGRK